MTDTVEAQYSSGEVAQKGLKSGALGLVASVVIGVASTAPAYSLAATLGFLHFTDDLNEIIILLLHRVEDVRHIGKLGSFERFLQRFLTLPFKE